MKQCEHHHYLSQRQLIDLSVGAQAQRTALPAATAAAAARDNIVIPAKYCLDTTSGGN